MPLKAEPKKYKTTLTGNKFTAAPDNDEIEVSIFGPGYGECVLLHVGSNNWFIIDSCIDPLSKDPIALSYLEAINVNPATSVRQVIATHWHDDHIRGLGKTFNACKSAEFVCSSALRSNEFMTLIDAYNTRSMTESAGSNEMGEVISELKERKKNGATNYAPKFAIANLPLWKSSPEDVVSSSNLWRKIVKALWRSSPSDAASKHDCSIHALSPSDEAVLAAQLDIAKLLPPDRAPKRALIAARPNHASVVIWASIGEYKILLGADLEELGDGSNGWTGILNSSLRPSGTASYFKVPHHGSKTAHNSDVWSNMLHANPIATLTPYVNGSTRLPTSVDVDRISSLTNRAFATTSPDRTVAVKRRSGTVGKTIKETVKNIRQLYPSIGHVRMRVKYGEEGRIELFGNAYRLD
jgi:beta-lactamase superfamily II metal-dependent hydrolase